MGKKKELKEQDGLTFFRVELENFKNLSKKIIDIGGKSILIVGGNGTGKSTLLDALLSGLDVKMRPSKPIKEGETHASISTTLKGTINGEPKEYIIDLYFSPKHQSGRLKVTDINGEDVKNPAGFIKGLIGNASLDIMSWMTDKKEKRLEKIKNLTGIAKELDAINVSIEEKKTLRKNKKERAEEMEAILKNHEYSQADIDKYSETIDLTPLQEELKAVSTNQEKWDSVKNKVIGFEREVSQLNQSADKGRAEIKRLEALIENEKVRVHESVFSEEGLLTKITQGNDWLAKVPRPSSDTISDKMIQANAHNEKVSQIANLAEKNKEMIKSKSEALDLDAEIKNLEGLRSDKISKSQLPIPDMTFDNDNIYLKGIPLEDGGVNTAGIMSVAVKMAIYQAQKSNLKNIFIQDASMFDKHSLKEAVQDIESNGMRAIIELVDWDGGALEVKFTETELG